MSKYAHRYTTVKTHLRGSDETLPNKWLYACRRSGTYATKMTLYDLPKGFLEINVRGHHEYIDLKDVKCLMYIPNYVFNHLYKDDFLYISYDKPIVSASDSTGDRTVLEDYVNIDDFLWGTNIPLFIEAVEEYSEIDVTDIKRALKEKEEWYDSGKVAGSFLSNPKPNYEKHRKPVWAQLFNKGDIVRIKEEYLNSGEYKNTWYYVWEALVDRVWIAPINSGLPLLAQELVSIEHITKVLDHSEVTKTLSTSNNKKGA